MYVNYSKSVELSCTKSVDDKKKITNTNVFLLKSVSKGM